MDEHRRTVQLHPAHPQELGRVLFRRLSVLIRVRGRAENSSRARQQRVGQLEVPESRRTDAFHIGMRAVQSRAGVVQVPSAKLSRRFGARAVANSGSRDRFAAGTADELNPDLPGEPSELGDNPASRVALAESEHQADYHARDGGMVRARRLRPDEAVAYSRRGAGPEGALDAAQRPVGSVVSVHHRSGLSGIAEGVPQAGEVADGQDTRARGSVRLGLHQVLAQEVSPVDGEERGSFGESGDVAERDVDDDVGVFAIVRRDRRFGVSGGDHVDDYELFDFAEESAAAHDSAVEDDGWAVQSVGDRWAAL